MSRKKAVKINGKVVQRTAERLSPWVSLVRKEVRFGKNGNIETYHCLTQNDYVAVLAQCENGLIPIVQQYRPAVRAYTWELPAGLIDAGESPRNACVRELKEEAGLKALQVTALGSYYADTGRLENCIHTFFVRASNPNSRFRPEKGIAVRFVTPRALRNDILSGKFKHQIHLGVFTTASLLGFDIWK